DVGRALLSVQGDLIATHDHDVTGTGIFSGMKQYAYGSNTVSASPVFKTASADGMSATTLAGAQFKATTSTGAGVETRPRNIAFNYIVRAA
ncbi:hypothetical protein, partial [Aeromonas salmonicida]|uniref:hypothetical protein n=1 Tax=Aeromonas salmonicida TaxID=645 RepID=UPI0037EF3692